MRKNNICKGAQSAKTDIEKILTRREDSGITVNEAVNELASNMYTIRDPTKDKPFELVMVKHYIFYFKAIYI